MAVSRIALLLSASLCVATSTLLAPNAAFAQGMQGEAMPRGMGMDDRGQGKMSGHDFDRAHDYDHGYNDSACGMGMMSMMGGGGMMGDHSMNMRMGMERGPMAMVHGLDLTDEQKKQVRQITRDLRNKHWDMMKQRMELADQLEEAYSAGDKPDPAKIGELYGKTFDIRRQMIQQSIETKNKIYDLLTAEQREQLKAKDTMPRHPPMPR